MKQLPRRHAAPPAPRSWPASQAAPAGRRGADLTARSSPASIAFNGTASTSRGRVTSRRRTGKPSHQHEVAPIPRTDAPRTRVQRVPTGSTRNSPILVGMKMHSRLWRAVSPRPGTWLPRRAGRRFRNQGCAALLALGAVLAACGAPAAPAGTSRCTGINGVQAGAWPHPARSDLTAVLCRNDQRTGWKQSLWFLESGQRATPEFVQVPLHGTGIAFFAWLNCPGDPVAHVIDRTAIGTLTFQTVRLESGPQVRVLKSTPLAPGSNRTRFPPSCSS